MVFPTPVFLFLFLPCVVGLYHLSPRRARNGVLVAASLGFYAWGEGRYLGLLLLAVGWNHLVGRAIGQATDPARRWRWLLLGVGGNLLALAWFKYARFLVDLLVDPADWGAVAWWEPMGLPLGISFFTFQCISYLVDVGRGECQPQASRARLALYVTMFPQLVAGPIVRYRELEPQLVERSVDLAGVAAGVRRFVVGLAKKVLIADQVGRVADAAFLVGDVWLTSQAAWAGALAYTLQIYFDFSGYSDMAIGLGQLFGMRFPENFRHPYVAESLRDFWRRWHITLSSWFRDYLYIPLGGSRGSRLQTARNLLATFFLCGLWHGAAWRFVVWGLFHGAFLSLERVPSVGRALEAAPKLLARAYVLLVVVVGWVIFRAVDLPAAGRVLRAMFLGGADHGPWALDAGSAVAMAVGVVACVPWPGRREATAWGRGLRDLGLVTMLLLCLMEVAATTHRPFLYFRF